MRKFNHFLVGFLPGLFLPILFIYVYLLRFYPTDDSFFVIIKDIFPSVMMGKLLLLSAMPNMVLAFVFYKSESFKIGIGCMSGGMPYLIASFFML